MNSMGEFNYKSRLSRKFQKYVYLEKYALIIKETWILLLYLI